LGKKERSKISKEKQRKRERTMKRRCRFWKNKKKSLFFSIGNAISTVQRKE
jgi:hypothetical protein